VVSDYPVYITGADVTSQTILVADDEPHIVELVSFYLRRAGFGVETALDGDTALKRATESPPALAVLDIMMPGLDGLQVCRALRERGDTPIILLTARSTDIDKIAGLKLGADDYVTKPFNPEELVARVEAVLRRSRAGHSSVSPNEVVKVARLEMDLGARTVAVAGAGISLTPREFDLLAMLARFPDTVLHREQLLDLVWGAAFYSHRSVDVHVARLREKLKGSGVRIETAWGSGYRLTASET
jgi:DNA-binding response OmpR family regulator